MHWRGDRVDGHFGTDPCNKAGYNENAIGDPTNTSTTSPCDEDLSFRNFIVAFEGLVGHDGLIPDADMQKFTDFILQVRLPPNPVTPLNNTYVGDALAGRGVFFSCGPDTTECAPGDPAATDQVDDCDGCHNLDPIHGLFGTGGEQTFEGETQNFKVAHMRNMYQKVGMFGTSANGTFLGDQVRGTGFLHDGSIDTVFDFLTVGTAFPGLGPGEPEELEQFSLEFPTDLAPVVGQQVTLVGAGNLDTNGRITLLIAQAGTSFDSAVLGGTVTECDLVVKGVLNGAARGWVYQPGGAIFQSDRAAQTHTDAQLRNVALTAGQELTYTCVPPGSGERIGIDADEDGAFDRDELDAGTGPDNAGSILGACSDGLDNDGDGLFDAADPGCIGIRSPNSENPACNDGVDNDGDGLTDYTVDVDMNGITDPPGDPVCIAADAVSERAGCQDGVNNDGQFGTDWDGGESVLGVGNGDPNGADPQCVVPWRQSEATAATGSSCGLGVELALLLPLLGLGYRSRRRRA
jgi:hypothetical protein